MFEHPGRQTMGASVFVCARGGTVVTCAATSGYLIEYDNRHLWMKLKSIKSSHFANYREAWDANRLIARGMIQPVLSAVYPLEQVGDAACRSIATCTRARSGCCASPPRRVSASTIPRSGPGSARTGSPCSAAMRR